MTYTESKAATQEDTFASDARPSANSRDNVAQFPKKPQFLILPRELLASPAWNAAPGDVLKIISRIGLEHSLHGGKDNGDLPILYDDLVSIGLRRHSIRSHILIGQALGLLTIKEGTRKRGDRQIPPNLYGLAWLEGGDNTGWQRFKTLDEARIAVNAVLETLKQEKEERRKARAAGGKVVRFPKKKPVSSVESVTGKSITVPVSNPSLETSVESVTGNPDFPVSKASLLSKPKNLDKELDCATAEGFEELCRVFPNQSYIRHALGDYRQMINTGKASHDWIMGKANAYAELKKGAKPHDIEQAEQWFGRLWQEIHAGEATKAQATRAAQAEAEKAKRIASGEPEGYDEFWKHYPRKTKTFLPTMETYRKIVDSGTATPDELIRGAKLYSKQFAPDRVGFALTPQEWLENRGWKIPSREPFV